MATLQGRAIKDTYKDLLQVSNSNSGVDGTLRTVEDGEGTSSALQVSTSAVKVNGSLDVTGSVTGVPHVDYRGNYSSSTSYVKDDVVVYNGSSYIAKSNTTGNAPTNATYWGLLASKGTDGTNGTNGTNGAIGPQGPQGPAGADGATGPQGPAGADGADGSDATVSTNLNNIDSALTATSGGRVGFGSASDTSVYFYDFNSGTHGVNGGTSAIVRFACTRSQNAAALAVRNLASDGYYSILQLGANPSKSLDFNYQVPYGRATIGFNDGQGNGLLVFRGNGTNPASPTADSSGLSAVHDNVSDLGISSIRWRELYCANSTINTSDINLKQDIEDLSEAEKNVAVRLKGLVKKFRWKDAVAEKGDDARIHIGVIAQEVKSAFEAEGLVAENYSLFCSDTSYVGEVQVPSPSEEGEIMVTQKDYSNVPKEGYTEVTRLSIRYSELLAFIISAL